MLDVEFCPTTWTQGGLNASNFAACILWARAAEPPTRFRPTLPPVGHRKAIGSLRGNVACGNGWSAFYPDLLGLIRASTFNSSSIRPGSRGHPMRSSCWLSPGLLSQLAMRRYTYLGLWLGMCLRLGAFCLCIYLKNRRYGKRGVRRMGRA